MNRFVMVALALLLAGGQALAQVTPAVNKGANSLNFTFGGIGTFGLAGTGPAGGIGISHFLSPSAAVRVGLQVRKYHRTLSFNGGAGATGVDGSDEGLQAGGAVDYLKYMNGATSRVRPYVGFGVGVMSVSNSTQPAAATGVTAIQTKNAPGGIPAGFANPGMTFDAHLNLGAEFFLFNEVSVAGEYLLNIFSRTSPADQLVINGATTTTTRGNAVSTIFGFGTAGASVRIYF